MTNVYFVAGRESDLWVIMEFCSNGNLLQFLRNRRDIYEAEWKGVSKDPNNQLTMTDLVIAAYQVARGMDFLASRMVSQIVVLVIIIIIIIIIIVIIIILFF